MSRSHVVHLWHADSQHGRYGLTPAFLSDPGGDISMYPAVRDFSDSHFTSDTLPAGTRVCVAFRLTAEMRPDQEQRELGAIATRHGYEAMYVDIVPWDET